jgi:hypothetical protein
LITPALRTASAPAFTVPKVLSDGLAVTVAGAISGIANSAHSAIDDAFPQYRVINRDPERRYLYEPETVYPRRRPANA